MKIRPEMISILEGSSDAAQASLRNVGPMNAFELNLNPPTFAPAPNVQRDIRPLNGFGQAVKGGK